MIRRRVVLPDPPITTNQGPAPVELLSAAEAAEVLRVSTKTLARYRRQGTGPAFIRYTGIAVFYDMRDIEAWLESKKASGASD